MSARAAATATTWNHNTHFYPLIVSALRPGGRALDVGCGEGLLTRQLAAAGAGSAVGIDTSADMVQEARSRSASSPDVARLDYVCGDVLDDLPGPHGGPFDLVACVATLHHLPLDGALQRLGDLTAPGGRVVVVGLANPANAVDVGLSLASVVAHRVASVRRGYWEHPAPVAEFSHTTADVRRAAARILPGSVLRSRLYWRYTLEWTAPT